MSTIRKDFLKTGLIFGGAGFVPGTSAFTQNLTENNMDKLVDNDGDSLHRPLGLIPITI